MSKQNCRISKERSNFSIIPNEVSQNLNYNLSALGLYVYLFSLADDWKFHKSHLRKVCAIGEKKLNKLLCILVQHRLIKIVQIRKENGQFAHFDIQIDDGTSFLINNIEESVQPDGLFCRTAENGAAVKQSYKENIYKEDIKTKKEKILSATDVAQESFDNFWFIYPVKKNKKRAQTIWTKNNLSLRADEIIKDVKERLINDSTWNNINYIPHPSTYLQFERWNDEVTLKTINGGKDKFNAMEYALDSLRKTQEAKKEEFNKKGIIS